MATIERNKDGTVKGILSMADMMEKDQPTKEQLEIRKKKAELEKKYNTTKDR